MYELFRLLMLKPLGINFEIHAIQKETPYFKRCLINIGKKLNQYLLKFNNHFFRYGKLWDIYPRLIKEKDPSEGIRSDEIIPILKKTFNGNVEIKYYNCSILHYALDQMFFDASPLV